MAEHHHHRPQVSHNDTAPATHSTNGAHPRSHSAAEAAAGIVPSHGISINFPDETNHSTRPQPVKHMSAPAQPQHSPIRHHRRQPSKTKPVKETLNARSHYGSSDDDGASVHRINQYIIKQEIGRGSFGAVHLAVDQFGCEYAVKEFSKSRLRKRAQSNLLRKPNQSRRPGHLAAGLGFNSPLHRLSSNDKLELKKSESSNNSLELIKEEIAIMKKLNHNNLVALIEVLDDPAEDSLYMVLEMCKKGVVMKVGLEVDEYAEPYPLETCRTWFRDMMLGIEYLHAQGIIHRDIKPDNCLITQDDVLKIVDFGVSEMFEKSSDMATAKSAGSPAFMPPELCVARHGQVSGKAADVWSMGVTLYCLRYGRIPFERSGLLEMYEAIREDGFQMDPEGDERFRDVLRRLLEKDPEKRITIPELREHPWVTNNGSDPLLPAEENCADLVDPPTDGEVEHAITGNMAHLMVVMRAVKRFKNILHRKRPSSIQGIFGRDSKIMQPPKAIRSSKSHDAHDRRPMDKILVTEGVHRDIDLDDEMRKVPFGIDDSTKRVAEINIGNHDEGRKHDTPAVHKQKEESNAHKPHRPSEPSAHQRPSNAQESAAAPGRARAFSAGKGHAHDPLTDTLFLDIGPSADDNEGAGDEDDGGALRHVVSESPPEVEMNIYEQAYQEEIKRILAKRGDDAGFHLTRRVEHREDIRSLPGILDSSREMAGSAAEKLSGLATRAREGSVGMGGGLAGLVEKAREQGGQDDEVGDEDEQGDGDGETPPLKAPAQFDGAGGEAVVANPENEEAKVPDSIVRAQAEAQAQLDAAKGAMPGMPGGFPVTPGLAAEGSRT